MEIGLSNFLAHFHVFHYKHKQDQVNNANSAFILINRWISLGFQSGLIGPGGLGGPIGPGGPSGPDRPGVSDGQSGQGGQGGQGGQVVRRSGGPDGPR